MIHDHDRPVTAGGRRRVDLDAATALRLLGSVSLGRIVFTRRALPAVRPVDHVLDGGEVVVRTHAGADVSAYVRQGGGLGAVVAYEADSIDPDTRLGWSVVVTGYARLVTDPVELARYRAVLRPWVDQAMDQAIRVRPELVTGILLSADGGPGEG
ncbi:pyridoxamine 5'-phosphate oxidase family protein [Streptomyces sp. NPDC048663]|uniref:pyridoxamine 5'-phosphate oxidase family protein n=1 Tax=Streptomyces sp. NPDC048663 TaxID=3155638 RepID=UPI0034342BB3